MDVKDIKCPLQWWEKTWKHVSYSYFCPRQILGLVGSQIEIERIFSLFGILTSIRRCCLQLMFFG